VRQDHGVGRGLALAPAIVAASATCGGGTCDQIEFAMTGTAQLPPIPNQNRPTFQQIVEFDRHRPR
jgi:hypothetical protein